MTAFEHVITIVSFVFALAIAHLLTCVIALVRAGPRVKYSFAHTSWMIISLLLIIAWWLALWDFRTLKSWDVGTVIFTLFGPILAYIFTGLVSPKVPEEGIVDLIEFHQTHSRQYIGAFIVSVFVGIIYGLFYGYFDHVAEQFAQASVQIPVLMIAILAYSVRNAKLQNGVALVLVVGMIVYFCVGQAPLE